MQEKKRKFEQLAPDAQSEVEGIRSTIFYRWPTPPVPAEGKLDWDDDLAVLFVDYGHYVLQEAVSWHRQNTERRPTIPAIREQCRLVREKQGRRPGAGDVAYFQHKKAIRDHLADLNDTSMVPYPLVIRDGLQFAALKRSAVAAGQQISRREVEDWWAWRDAETDREWKEMRAKGIKELIFRGEGDRGGVRTGGDLSVIGESGIGEIVTGKPQEHLAY